MHAPDKIYLTPRINDETSLCALWFNKKQIGDCFEYLSKDTLLEWAKEQQTKLTMQLEAQDDPVHWGQRNAFQQLIDKLNSL